LLEKTSGAFKTPEPKGLPKSANRIWQPIATRGVFHVPGAERPAMNPLLLRLTDGTAFFVGMSLIVVCCLAEFWFAGKIARYTSNTVGVISVVLIVFSATPLPLFVYAIWGIAIVAAFFFLRIRRTEGRARRQTRTAIVAFVAVSGVAICLELPYHISPVVKISAETPVYVIGDSISAGTVTGEKSWPEVLAGATGLKVANLAKPGAKTAAAFGQAERLPTEPGLVIVEIGGNDLFSDKSSGAFERELDRLLTAVRQRGHRIVMFELPLPPAYNGFGLAQRRLAGKHSVTLIPKWNMARVFGTQGATVDGLHLSAKGHELMASQVERLLRIE
jgi:lysophospholipase L1-like esterase